MRAKVALVISLLLILGGCVVYPMPPDPALDLSPTGEVSHTGDPGPPPGYGRPYSGSAVMVAPPPVYVWPFPGFWFPPPHGPWHGPGPWGRPPGPPPR